MAIQWDALVASAAVATGTTLLIEITAKPWLELRKDRLLRRERTRDETLSELFFLSGEIDSVARWVSGGTRDIIPTVQQIEDRITRIHGLDVVAFPKLSRPIFSLLQYILGATAGRISVGLEMYLAVQRRDPAVFQRLSKETGIVVSGYGRLLEESHGGEFERVIARVIADALDESRRNLKIPLRYAKAGRWRILERWYLRREARRIMRAPVPLRELLIWSHQGTFRQVWNAVARRASRSAMKDRNKHPSGQADDNGPN